MTSQIIPIPQPKPEFIIGNAKEIDTSAFVGSLTRLAKEFDGIYKLQFPNDEIIVVYSQELVNELCDEKRFYKNLARPLETLRDVAGDALFTAHTHEPNWQKAHRILMPAFGPLAIRKMFPEMLDISEQMMMKLEREDPKTEIDVVDIMTRATLDTIALCAFDYRFNSFYRETMHPFVNAMVDTLVESGQRSSRLPIQNKLMFLANRKYQTNIEYMNKIADELIAERKVNLHANQKKDLLNLMLAGKDPVTGEGLSDENIRQQLITFLVAGHETTSGMLSFAVHLLLKNPDKLKKAQAEVDAVLGNQMPTVHDMPKLEYINQVLKETLRLEPTAPAFVLSAHEDTVIGGRHEIKKGGTIVILSNQLHRDEKVWEDAEAFKPERFEQATFEALPPNSWKPFGNGQRACIGRSFAMQEAILILSMLLQRFDISEANPNYELKIAESLTVKPDGLYIKAKRREHKIVTNNLPLEAKLTKTKPSIVNKKEQTPLLVLYGSNMGSSENFAQQIAADASQFGFKSTIGILDNYVNNLPKKGAVIIVTSSYEGQPTNNALSFVNWLDTLKGSELKGLQFGVFGCGHKDWARTYQAIPKKIDTILEQAGGQRIITRGEADAGGDFFGNFDNWYDGFWSTLGTAFKQKATSAAKDSRLIVEAISTNRTTVLRQNDLQTGIVIQNRELVNMNHPLGRSKRHIEIELPTGMSYKAGDYLAILPSNPKANVQRALTRFSFNYESKIIINKEGDSLTFLPTGYPVTVHEILSNYVELSQPATKKQVQKLAEATVCPPHKIELMILASNKKYTEAVLNKRLSVLDILEQYEACNLSFSDYLDMLPPLKPRQYSISSSPLSNPNHLTLTVAVVDTPAWSGQGQFKGVASNYLAYAETGSPITIETRPANTNFHLPEDINLPVIMVCAGTGIAPFIGFIQERAIQKAQGKTIGKMALFFGCDHPEVDLLYKEQLSNWEEMGILSVYTAFSKQADKNVKYVQDSVLQEKAEIIRLFEQNAHIYVCGDGKNMAPAVREVFVNIYQEMTNYSATEARQKWETEIEHVRYATDVFV